jgi:UDP-N-acetylglucosamine--N-acetylmuramyl-(pentapeptide) pyrophosphoryl-undecaprenol N-acetylglucosamine transferase
MRVLIAGGGTGGHLFPALAIAQELRRQEPEAEILFLGGDRGLERRIIPREGFAFTSVPVRGWSRKLRWQNVTFPWFLFSSLWRSFMILRRFRPGVVVGTGGYVSGPVVLLASLLGVPTLIQEQNSLPGVTTKMLSRRVNQVHLSFSESRKYFRRKNHLRMSGNPLRQGLDRVERRAAAQVFSLDPEGKTVLILGGSQGAHSINMAVAQGFDRLLAAQVQILWQTGQRDFAQIQGQFGGRGPKTVVADFIENMGAAYGVADVVICRAGATTVAEIAACGLPAIFVPYPYATGDHQRINAQALVKAGAATMVLNGELKGNKLISLLLSLLRDDPRLREMAARSKMLGRPEAAETLARAIRELARSN